MDKNITTLIGKAIREGNYLNIIKIKNGSTQIGSKFNY